MPTSYLQTILRCFCAMEIDGLRLFLKDKYTYQEATKEVFLEKIESIFEKHRAAGDTEMLLYPGVCAGQTCDNCGKKGYRFVGNYTKNYIDLLFEEEGDDIKDIYACCDFKSFKEVENKGKKTSIFFDLDDRASFPKTPTYWSRVYSAQNAYNEIITQPPRTLRFDEIESWLAKHAELYHRLGGYFAFKPSLKWTDFLQLYHDLEELISIISTNLNQYRKANREMKRVVAEQELLDWIVRYEEIYLNSKLELMFFMEEMGEDFGFFQFDKYYFTGEVFTEVYAFFNPMAKNYYEFLAKYKIYTGEEVGQLTKEDKSKEKFQENDLLSFHLQKRKELEALGVFLPYNMGKREKPEEEIPF